MEQVRGVLVMTLLEMLEFLVLITVHYLIPIILRINLMILMILLALQRKSLVLTLIKQRENFVQVCIIMLIAVICLLMVEKSINLKLILKISTSLFIFV